MMTRNGVFRIPRWVLPLMFIALPVAVQAQTTCMVLFDAQGGDWPNPAGTNVTVGSPYGALAITARSGYSFEGWWTAGGGAGTRVTPDTVVTETVEHTLYAKWLAKIYTVSFDAQGGSAPGPANKIVTFDSPYGTLATTILAGYTLSGWWTEPDGAGTQVTSASTVTFTNNHTLHAKWTANSYTVTFDAQGGDEPLPASKSVTFESTYGKLATITRSGYSFDGWWTGPGGTGSKVTTSTAVTITANQTLYAKWTANSYTVSFDAQGGDAPSPSDTTVTVDLPYGTLAATTRSGYTFAGWWTAAGGGALVTPGTIVKITADQTLYAKWTANGYTVTFDAQGGNAPSPVDKSVIFNSAYGAMAAATRAGYTFAGWWWTEDCDEGEEVTAATTVTVTMDHTLYAKWTALAYTVTFDPQGGSVPDPASMGVTYGSTCGELPTPTRWGYNFLGWWTGIGGTGALVDPGTVVKNAADFVLYAKWAATGHIRFVLTDYMATEGYKRTLYVERVGGSNGVVFVNFKTKPKAAMPWQDYIPKSGTLMWADGESGVKEIRIPIIADGRSEGYEAFRVLLKKPFGAALSGSPEATVIIPAHKNKAASGVKDATALQMTKLSKALEGESMTWFTSAQAPWRRQPYVSVDGVDAGMSGATAFTQVSWIQTDVEGAGTLDFDWLVKGVGMDACLVLVDGKVWGKLDPGLDWVHETLTLGAGDHTVRWVFVGDIRLSGGTAFLDQVKWAPDQK